MNAQSPLEFLSYLRNLNVKLSAEGDRLRYSAPTGVMTSDLLDELAARKTEILQFLKDACLATRPQPLAIKRIPRDGELPPSFAQARLWLLNQLESGGVAYNIPSLFRLKGNFNQAAFEQSLSEIVRRHEVLRTYYLAVDGRPVQKIAPPGLFRIPVVDLQALPETVRAKEAARLAFVDAKQPFDLAKAPLMRATLLKLAPEEQILLLNIHHIAFDVWSFGVLTQEMSALYKAFLNGKPSPLPDLPIQYVDFAAWQQEWLQGEVLQAQLDYWKERLSGSLPVLELPTDRPRPALQTYNGSNVSFALSKELTKALKILSRQEDVTLFVTLLAAFKVVLLRYTGLEDIIVGTPIANRNRTEIEGLIGFFVNTLVMRTDLSGNPTFREFLRRVQDTALGAYAHQDLPFEKLVEELNPERDVSRSPIFQVLFGFLNMPVQLLQLPGLAPSRLEFHNAGAQFDLTLYLEETDQRLAGLFSYNTDLWDEATVARMAGHFETLLDGIVSNREQRLHELPLLTRRERQQLLVEWNETKADYPASACIHEQFESQAQRTPEAIAVEFDGQRLTYSELNARSNQFAQHLQALGVGPDVLVGLCVERSLEMLIALLGILKAGGAYLPLDPAFPRERLAFMLDDAKPRVLVTQTTLLGKLPPCQSPVVCIDAFSLAGEVRTAARRPDSHNLAYILYTSGSTGKPKGVEICHRAVVNFLNSMRVAPGMEARDTLLSVTTLSFDIFGLEIWLPLTTGARVVIVPQEVAMDGRQLAEVMVRCGATVMQAAPSTWQLLLESAWAGNPGLKILCGGEAWSQQLAEQLLPKCGSLWNMYGPTETTIWSAVDQVREGKPVLLGRPIANTQFYVVDSHLQPVPVGVPGELLIGGDGLARGYLNRPELTAEKFIANPFSTESSSRLYRTGDLVRHLPDGNIEFLGRIDQQVKIRGFRIELGEIESVLRTHSGVREAIVVAREDEREKRLVAYIVRSKQSDCTPTELRHHLQERLPDYMLPAAFVFLAALPLTPNGKVNRKALPSPGDFRVDLETTWVPPDTETEQVIARVWEELLGVSRVGRDNNFFDLGGHSLLLMRVRNRLEQAFARQLPVVEMFRHPTVRSLAEYMTDHEAEATTLARNREQIARYKESAQRRLQRRKRIAVEEGQPG